MAIEGTVIERLIVRIFGDASQYHKTLGEVQRDTKNWQGEMEGVNGKIEEVDDSLDRLGDTSEGSLGPTPGQLTAISVGLIGMVAAIAATAAAIRAFSRAWSTTMREIEDGTLTVENFGRANIETLEEANRAVHRLQETFAGLRRELVVGVAPALQELVEGTRFFASAIRNISIVEPVRELMDEVRAEREQAIEDLQALQLQDVERRFSMMDRRRFDRQQQQIKDFRKDLAAFDKEFQKVRETQRMEAIREAERQRADLIGRVQQLMGRSGQLARTGGGAAIEAGTLEARSLTQFGRAEQEMSKDIKTLVEQAKQELAVERQILAAIEAEVPAQTVSIQ